MGVYTAVAALLVGAGTDAGGNVFLQRAEISAPGVDVPMPHIWYEVLENPPATKYRFPGGTVAIGGTPSYGRSLFRALVQVTAVGDTFTQANQVIEQLRPMLDGWNGVAGATTVKGIFVNDNRPDYAQLEDTNSDQLDLDVWYEQ